MPLRFCTKIRSFWLFIDHPLFLLSCLIYNGDRPKIVSAKGNRFSSKYILYSETCLLVRTHDFLFPVFPQVFYFDQQFRICSLPIYLSSLYIRSLIRMDCSFYFGFFRGRENKFSAFSFSFWVILKKFKEKIQILRRRKAFFA